MIGNNKSMVTKALVSFIMIVMPMLCMADYVPGEVLVRLKRGVVELPQGQAEGTIESITGNQNLKNFLSNVGLIKIEKVFWNFEPKDTLKELENGEIVKIQDLSLVFKMSFNPDANILVIIDSLKQYSDVVYAEPNYIMRANFWPNDDSFSKQWSLWQSNDCDIDAEFAWDIETGNYNVKIGILDEGVDYYNADLGTYFGPGHKIRGGYDFVNNDSDPRPTVPQQEVHGTHVAGIASALTNNHLGISGISGGTGGSDIGCTIYSYRILDPSGSGTVANAVQGIERAVIDGVSVMNASWRGAEYSEAIRDAISVAYKTNKSFIASRGNTSDNRLLYPSCFDRHWIISVGATNQNDYRANFSSYGQGMDVVAPGLTILSTVPVTSQGSIKYDTMSGTSMAAPHVTGLTSLIYSRAYEKGISLQPEDVEGIIRATAYDPPWSDPGYDDEYGAGRINAYDALRYFNYPQSIRMYTVTATSGITVGFYTRQLIGIPGLPDGTYFVMVNEYRSDLTLPSDIIEFLGIWGLGRLTTGYSNAGPNYGEGYCEVEKLPNGQYRAKTYVYLVMEPDPPHQTIGWFPLNPYQNNVLFRYSVFSVNVVPPYNLHTEYVKEDSVKLVWNYNYPQLIDCYRVYRGGTQVDGDIPPNQKWCIDAGVTRGQSYQYQVFAKKGTVLSSPATITVQVPWVDAPTLRPAVEIPPNQVRISWHNNSNYAQKYIIHRWNDITNQWHYGYHQANSPIETLFVDNVEWLHKYKYVVVARATNASYDTSA
ncbi:MAG: S8 family serine peptidase, partial [candidate division WOR-3 bacterium]